MKRVMIASVVVIAAALFLSRNLMLRRAASAGGGGLMTFALKIGADVDSPGSAGNTPLLAAVTARQPAAVKRLIAAGANVNTPNDQSGATPLMIAASLGEEAMVDALLDAGASVAARDKEEHTAYWYAFESHQPAIGRKVHYVQKADITLPTPSFAPPAAKAPEAPTGYAAMDTATSQLTITDTTGWSRVGQNQYMKTVSREEADRLEKERRRIQDEERAERRRKQNEAARNP